MAKYFLGSVGEVEAYEIVESFSGATSMNLAFTSKSLTDSAVNISVNKEQIIDSYNGAPVGVFYHSPNITVTLSDVMWSPQFLEVALGQNFNEMCDDGNIEYHQIKVQTNADGYATLNTSPFPKAIDLPWNQSGSDPYLVIGQLVGEQEWHSYNYDPENHRIGYDPNTPYISHGVLKPNAIYCFKYPISSIRSRELKITTKILPKELFLKITTPVFYAECLDHNFSSSQNLPERYYISTGQIVGSLVYEIPRWALDGDTSFSLSMSGTCGMQLSGTVLESVDEDNGEPVFMRLREFIQTKTWYEGLVDLVWIDSSTENKTISNIYGIYNDGSYRLITSNKSKICLVYQPDSGNLTSTDENTYSYGGTTYNVTGIFNTGSGTVLVHPAVIWTDDNGDSILLILNNIQTQVTVS